MKASKKVKGDDYEVKSEKYIIKSLKKDRASKKVAGLADEFKKSKTLETKKPKPKVMKKGQLIK